MKIKRSDAIAQGFTIDNHATPRPVAYKGPRFQPTEIHEVVEGHPRYVMGVTMEMAAIFAHIVLMEHGVAAALGSDDRPKSYINLYDVPTIHLFPDDVGVIVSQLQEFESKDDHRQSLAHGMARDIENFTKTNQPK